MDRGATKSGVEDDDEDSRTRAKNLQNAPEDNRERTERAGEPLDRL